jgi:hypothetical protein
MNVLSASEAKLKISTSPCCCLYHTDKIQALLFPSVFRKGMLRCWNSLPDAPNLSMSRDVPTLSVDAHAGSDAARGRLGVVEAYLRPTLVIPDGVDQILRAASAQSLAYATKMETLKKCTRDRAGGADDAIQDFD